MGSAHILLKESVRIERVNEVGNKDAQRGHCGSPSYLIPFPDKPTELVPTKDEGRIH